ncbi:hypothetical protein WISP_32704 [Willisornis vidua]|uniref:Major facilitator superfamily (MFS) profile domain-containing protein n=1 Tax=Willisornis vidua TaxID=1566151 RepID=A0ABQ9DJU7_9PASS|nr:hypothetical protein WISP_32704 [Willisornis vidua]
MAVELFALELDEGKSQECVQYQGLFQMITVLGIGGTFQIGFQISTITYMSQHVKAFINETWLERYGYPIQQDNLLFLWSITVSIFGIGGILGSAGSRYLTVKYGKKKCLLGNNLLMIVAASLLGCSKVAQSFEMILIGRFMCGISAGLSAPLHHQYVGEISPKKLRGFANSTSSFFWSLGKAIGQISGQRELLGTPSLWPVLMAACGFPALVQLVTLPFFPESPPYLLMRKEDQEGCKKAIRQLWGEGHHQAEIDDIMKEKAAMKNTKILSVLELVKEPAFRWQLYMLVILTSTIQLCGINAIYFYTFEVLQAAGFDERMVYYMTLSLGLSELVAALVCSSIIERLGRKVLLRGGYWIMGSLLACITVTLSLQLLQDQVTWVTTTHPELLYRYPVKLDLKQGGATVSTRAEIFTLSCRPPAFVISAVLNCLGMFVIGTTFPFIVVQFRGLYQMILVLGIGGSFPYGFHISVINYPSVHIRKFINETWIERHGSPLHPETIMLLWSFIVSIYGIGGLLGCLCCTYLTTKYRKKKCQIFTNLIMLVAAVFMALSKTAKSFEMILAGRLLYGIGSGFSMNIHPQYVGEISPKKLRGFANSTVAVFLTLGKLTGQVIGLRSNQMAEAAPAPAPVDRQTKGVNVTPPDGAVQIYFYSFEVFHTAKFEEYLIPYVSLGIGLCECLSSILCSTLIDRFGRKVLLWCGYTLMCSVLALLTMTLSLQHRFFWMHYFSVILIFLFVVFYGTGPLQTFSAGYGKLSLLSTAWGISIGKIGEQENKVYSKLLCDLLNKQQKIPSDRTYVSFFNISAGKCKLEQHLQSRCPGVVTAYS